MLWKEDLLNAEVGSENNLTSVQIRYIKLDLKM